MLTSERRAQLGLISAGAVLVACLVILGGKAAERNVLKAAEAPAFKLPDADGQEVTLAQFRGRIVVLLFTSARCTESSRLAQQFEQFTEKYEAGGTVKVLAVDASGHSDAGYLTELRVQRRLSGQCYPTLVDAGRRLCGMYGIERTPMVVVVGPQGRVRYKGSFEHCEEAVQRLLKESSQPVAFTQAFAASPDASK